MTTTQAVLYYVMQVGGAALVLLGTPYVLRAPIGRWMYRRQCRKRLHQLLDGRGRAWIGVPWYGAARRGGVRQGEARVG